MLASLRSARSLSRKAPARGLALYESVLDTIGKTPIIKVSDRTAPPGVEMYVKAEYFNPLSSVKDRLALSMVEQAEQRGEIRPGDTLVEATSGNTGIALAMVGAAKGYQVVICMAEPFSVERRRIMRMLGAKVVVTPAAEKGTGMVKKAKELAKAHGWHLTRQFETDANARMHACTTGPEILADFGAKRLDYFVLGYGTGGTLSGAGAVLKTARPELKIHVVEPADAPLLASGIQQDRDAEGSPATTHPSFAPHPIQGWTPDFVPLVLQEGMDAHAGLVDELFTVSGKEAIEASRGLARNEGIFTGISGGAAFAQALKTASAAPPGSVVLAMLADTAERYLSTALFAGIEADMDESERGISMSTPGFQLPPPEL